MRLIHVRFVLLICSAVAMASTMVRQGSHTSPALTSIKSSKEQTQEKRASNEIDLKIRLSNLEMKEETCDYGDKPQTNSKQLIRIQIIPENSDEGEEVIEVINKELSRAVSKTDIDTEVDPKSELSSKAVPKLRREHDLGTPVVSPSKLYDKSHYGLGISASVLIILVLGLIKHSLNSGLVRLFLILGCLSAPILCEFNETSYVMVQNTTRTVEGYFVLNVSAGYYIFGVMPSTSTGTKSLFVAYHNNNNEPFSPISIPGQSNLLPLYQFSNLSSSAQFVAVSSVKDIPCFIIKDTYYLLKCYRWNSTANQIVGSGTIDNVDINALVFGSDNNAIIAGNFKEGSNANTGFIAKISCNIDQLSNPDFNGNPFYTEHFLWTITISGSSSIVGLALSSEASTQTLLYSWKGIDPNTNDLRVNAIFPNTITSDQTITVTPVGSNKLDNAGFSISRSSDGNFYAAGTVVSAPDTNKASFSLWKISVENGVIVKILWTKYFDLGDYLLGSNIYVPITVIDIPQNNITFMYVYPPSHTNFDARIIVTNKSGDLLQNYTRARSISSIHSTYELLTGAQYAYSLPRAMLFNNRVVVISSSYSNKDTSSYYGVNLTSFNPYCGPGGYFSTPSTCSPCSANSYSIGNNVTSCTACFAYSNSTDGSSNCTCAQGKIFNNSTGIPNCENCPDGKYFANNNCVPCAVGTYINSSVTQCTLCSVGYYANETGSVSCKQCDAGFYQNQTGQDKCLSCSLGNYSLAGATSCSKCSAGTYGVINSAGAASCVNCTPGTYQNLTAQISCPPCPSGTYTNLAGSTSCDSCKTGSVPNADATDCTVCGKGKKSKSNNCELCPVGSYQDTTEQSDCKVCPIGTYTNEMGQSSCTPCSNGSYQNSTGKSYCDPCPQNQFQNQSGKSYCTKCSQDFFTSDVGSTSCLNCSDPKNIKGQVPANCIYKGIFNSMAEFINNTVSSACFTLSDNTYTLKKNFTKECREAYHPICCDGSRKNNKNCSDLLEIYSGNAFEKYCSACPFMNVNNCPADKVCWNDTNWNRNDDDPYMRPYSTACLEGIDRFCKTSSSTFTSSDECAIFNDSNCGATVANSTYTSLSTFVIRFTNKIKTNAPSDCKGIFSSVRNNAVITCSNTNDTSLEVNVSGLDSPILSYTFAKDSVKDFCSKSMDYLTSYSISKPANIAQSVTVRYTGSNKCTGYSFTYSVSVK